MLTRRFAAVEKAAQGVAVGAAELGLSASDRALARRVLRPLEARWHDGDENLVRGMLDRWVAMDAPPARAAAERLLQAAGELARIDARNEAWWFFLWEMESMLVLVAGDC